MPQETLVRIPFLLAAALAASAPALAQTERLPARSRSERHVQDLNRSLDLQQRNLGQSQQTQFEINALRQEIQRQNLMPPTTFGGNPGCPRGSIGC